LGIGRRGPLQRERWDYRDEWEKRYKNKRGKREGVQTGSDNQPLSWRRSFIAKNYNPPSTKPKVAGKRKGQKRRNGKRAGGKKRGTAEEEEKDQGTFSLNNSLIRASRDLGTSRPRSLRVKRRGEKKNEDMR